MRRHHPIEKIIGDKEARPMTRNRLRNESCLLSKIEPKIVRDALQDDDWCNAMKDKIKKIEKNMNLTLVARPTNKNVIGTKWLFIYKGKSTKLGHNSMEVKSIELDLSEMGTQFS